MGERILFTREIPGKSFDDIEIHSLIDEKIPCLRFEHKKQRELPEDFDEKAKAAYQKWVLRHEDLNVIGLFSLNGQTWTYQQLLDEMQTDSDFAKREIKMMRGFAESIKTMEPEECLKIYSGE